MIHYTIIVTVWLAACLIIAKLGARYRFGFWGYFFGSVLLTPLFGLLLLLAAIPPKDNTRPQPRT